MNKRLLSVAIGAALAAGAVGAHAIEAKLSGQVSRSLMYVDDGINNEAHNVDNDNSSTRFRFTGAADVVPGVKAGVVFETEFQSNPSNEVTQAVKQVAPTLLERHMNAFFQGGFGTVSLGQGDGAANGGVEVDLSGTAIAHYADIPAIGGAFTFRTSAGGTGPAISAVTSQQDFESRYDRLRYDTPAFGPVTFAASVGQKDNFDVRELALWYASDVAGGKLAGSLGFSRQDTATADFDDETIGGSISWLMSNGFNVTYAMSKRDITTTREGKFNYLKVGYKTGSHAMSADIAKADDQAASGDEAEMIGLAYVYSPTKWAELFAHWKNHSLDRAGSTFEDIQFLSVGTRLKF